MPAAVAEPCDAAINDCVAVQAAAGSRSRIGALAADAQRWPSG